MCRLSKSGIKIAIMLITAGLLFACSSLYQDTAQPTKPIVKATKKNYCPALPITFKEIDLVGTWEASYSLYDQDTLILKEDGTYKQIFDNPAGSYCYESDWQKWWVEPRESGFIRLHLNGMRRCDGPTSICEREGGGIDPQFLWSIDYCENEVIEMPDEVVLIVTGSKDNPLRGIILRQTRLAGSEWTWSFRLQEEKESP